MSGEANITVYNGINAMKIAFYHYTTYIAMLTESMCIMCLYFFYLLSAFWVLSIFSFTSICVKNHHSHMKLFVHFIFLERLLLFCSKGIRLLSGDR